MSEEIVYEEGDERVAELVPVARGRELAVAPEIGAGDLVRRLAVIRESMTTAMKPDVDYGVIPGTDKPALLKPGAEKLSVLFQLDVQLDNEKTWGPGDHLTVSSKATVFHAPSGARLGYGEGMCSTREAKYAFRNASRKCPSCGAEAIIKGKQEYGGGWVCFKKKNGCGAKFGDSDSAITGQQVGQVDNPALPDLWNTVVKMAEKRARVDAVLAVTGASALFTQDIEQNEVADDPPPAEETATKPTAAERKKLDTVIASLAAADPDTDWAVMADKYARREFGHGIAQLTRDEIGKAVAAMTTHLESLTKEAA